MIPFDELAVLTQVAAICRYVGGVKTSFAPLDTPMSLDRNDLPAAVPYLGPGSRDVNPETSSRASCQVDESQTIIVPVYLVAAPQGFKIGEMVKYSIPFLSLFLTAFDGRPNLVNADGKSPQDFAWRDAGVRQAHIRSHTGVTVQAFGGVGYFTVEFTLVVDGRRATQKVEGN